MSLWRLVLVGSHSGHCHSHPPVYVPISATATTNTANDSNAFANHVEAANSDELLESGAEGASRESGYETREPSPA